jgi:hypothetical protein
MRVVAYIKSWNENGVDSPPEKGELEGVTLNMIHLFSNTQKRTGKIVTIWKRICGCYCEEKNWEKNFTDRNL